MTQTCCAMLTSFPPPYRRLMMALIFLEKWKFKTENDSAAIVLCQKTIEPSKFQSGTLELCVFWWNIPWNLSQSYAEKTGTLCFMMQHFLESTEWSNWLVLACMQMTSTNLRQKGFPKKPPDCQSVQAIDSPEAVQVYCQVMASHEAFKWFSNAMTSHEAERVIFQSHEQLEAVIVIECGRTHAHVYHDGTEIFMDQVFCWKIGRWICWWVTLVVVIVSHFTLDS